MHYLAEVKTLARLNHTNIVPYKAAWIEPSLESKPIKYLSQNYRDRECCSSDVELSSFESKLYQTEDGRKKELSSNSFKQYQVLRGMYLII